MSARPSGGAKAAVFLTGEQAGIANAVCLPIMCISAIIFWRRRHIHPIQERYPQLVSFFNVTCILLVLCNCWSDFLGTRIPCYAYNQLINTVLAPTLGLVLAVRAWLLLFHFEVTKDMLALESRVRAYGVAANGGNGAAIAGTGAGLAARLAKDFKHSPLGSGRRSIVGPPTGLATITSSNNNNNATGFVGIPAPLLHQPSMAAIRHSMQSWFTRHHKLIKPSFLKRVIIVLEIIWCSLYVSLSIYDPAACAYLSDTAYELGNYNLFLWCGLEVLSIAVMATKLARHGGDGFGIKSEFKAQATLGAVLLVILISVMDHSDDPLNDFLTLCIFFGVNVLSVMWPIARSYQFERRQRALAAQVQRIVKLDDLLAIPEGATAFWRFLASEFSSELLGFHQHVVQFRSMSNIPIVVAGSTTPNGSAVPPSPQPFALDDHTTAVAASAATTTAGGNRRASIRIHNNHAATNNGGVATIKTDGDSPRTPTTPNTNMTSSPNGGTATRLFAAAIVNAATTTTTDSVMTPTAVAATTPVATMLSPTSSSTIGGSPVALVNSRLSSSSPVFAMRPAQRGSVVATSANAIVLGASPGFGPMSELSVDVNPVDVHGEQRIKAVLNEADDIFALFVVDGAPFQINISASTRSGVYNSLERYRSLISVHVHETPIRAPLTMQQVDDTIAGIRRVFDEADDAVMKLMSTGSFARFRSGAFYARLLDSLQVNGSPSSGPKSKGGAPVAGPSRPHAAAGGMNSDLHVSSMVGSGGRDVSNHSPKGAAMAVPSSPPPLSSPKFGQQSHHIAAFNAPIPRFYSRSDPSAVGPAQFVTGHNHNALAGHRSNPSSGSSAVVAVAPAPSPVTGSPINPNNGPTTVAVWIDPALPATQSHTSLSPFSRSPQLGTSGHHSHGSHGGNAAITTTATNTVTPVTSKFIASANAMTGNGNNGVAASAASNGAVRSPVVAVSGTTILATIQHSNSNSRATLPVS